MLRFVDCFAGIVYRFDPADGSLASLDVGQVIGTVLLRESGGLVAALKDGVAWLDEATGTLELFAAIERDDPGSRLNDSKCDPAGRLWTGTLRYDLAPGASSLYRVLPDGTVTRVAEGGSISNGIGWSPAGDRMYYIDTGAGTLDVFDYDLATGTASNRTTLRTFTPAGGLPDGLAVDADGDVWVAFFGGGRVERLSPAGELVERIELPVSQPTSVAFGGDGLVDLYITTATYAVRRAARRGAAGGGDLRLPARCSRDACRGLRRLRRRSERRRPRSRGSRIAASVTSLPRSSPTSRPSRSTRTRWHRPTTSSSSDEITITPAPRSASPAIRA